MTADVNVKPGHTQPTIAAGFAAALVDFIVERGVSAQILLTRAGVTSADIAKPDARLPITRYVSLLEASKELCGDTAIALKFGEAVRFEDVSIVGLIGLASPTMGAGRDQLNRFARLLIDAEGESPEMLQLTRDDEGVWLELGSPIFAAHPVLVETAFARFVCGVTRSGRYFPNAVHFSFEAPPHYAEYERIFRVPITFLSHRNALLIDEDFLAIKLPPTNRYVFGLLCERAEMLLSELRAVRTTRARVEATLIPILHTGEIDMETIAQMLALSSSTLYRQLRSEGVHYEAVVDELRRTMALHFLEAKKTSVNETAYLVGFSEASAFSRAFKRWTGKSPSDYRKERD